MWLLSEDDRGDYELTRFSDQGSVPAYAILSHTWLLVSKTAEGADVMDEPTFQELRQGRGQLKGGYSKVRFCGKQAKEDGLQYFWVDTCCINKDDPSELAHAISSMFRWYQQAEKCYVYLADIPWPSSMSTAELMTSLVELHESRWFYRGWTLQELLAPRHVMFFSAQGLWIGDKASLEDLIHNITHIPLDALRGMPLLGFSREERFLWTKSRQTTRPEDMAYSLFGIFDVNLLPLYGEGAAGAMKRLGEALDRRERCIRDLRLTDPEQDKERIQQTKGGLLEDAYSWILNNEQSQRWRDTSHSSLLWIKGDPGKGKTMLLCGIINELKKSPPRGGVLSYYFCQATDRQANNATAVLRGLLFMLLKQKPSLVSPLQAEYDIAGRSLFEDVNAYITLAKILRSMLADPLLSNTYVIIDALDECSTDLPLLLELLVGMSEVGSCVKWIVTSRNYRDIERELERATQSERLSLELNQSSIATAVTAYVSFKVDRLARENDYDPETQTTIKTNLLARADNTFLWVALVCQELARYSAWEVVEISTQYPRELSPLYRRMLAQLSHSRHAHLCQTILAVALVVRRPLTYHEMQSFVNAPKQMSGNEKAWTDVIGHCGSFLTFRHGIISFVHQSAKEFLTAEGQNHLSPRDPLDVERHISVRSLELFSQILQRDIYGVADLGMPAKQIERPTPDPLAAVRYSCAYWVEHYEASRGSGSYVAAYANKLIDGFLRERFLQWLEASSLIGSMSEAQVAVRKLEVVLQIETREPGPIDRRSGVNPQASQRTPDLLALAHDARRFLMAHKTAIEHFPLQAYASALRFSPLNSAIGRLYENQCLVSIAIKPPLPTEWDACLQTLEGHGNGVTAVAFSPDSSQLASASADGTVKIWEASSGRCVQTLAGHGEWVTAVAFSPDSSQLASASWDGTVKVWEASSGQCVQTLAGHGVGVTAAAFSPDSSQLASASWDGTVKVWEASSGRCVQTFDTESTNRLSFDASGTCIHTGKGVFVIQTHSSTVPHPQRPQHAESAPVDGSYEPSLTMSSDNR